MTIEQKIARALLKIDAVGFVAEPIRFVSGILAPVYVDNRKLPYYPKYWEIVLDGMKRLIRKKKIHFDVVAGIESAGIPHSAALAYTLKKPSIFVRKKLKDHGTKKMTEGGPVKNKNILLIEDLVTTGGSSLLSVRTLRNEGARVKDCLVIVTYGFPESKKAFKQAKVRLHSLVPFPIILSEAVALKKCTTQQAAQVTQCYSDPWRWTRAHESA